MQYLEEALRQSPQKFEQLRRRGNLVTLRRG